MVHETDQNLSPKPEGFIYRLRVVQREYGEIRNIQGQLQFVHGELYLYFIHGKEAHPIHTKIAFAISIF